MAQPGPRVQSSGGKAIDTPASRCARLRRCLAGSSEDVLNKRTSFNAASVLAFCLVAILTCFGEPGSGKYAAVAAEKPNILFVLTDDADLSLIGEMPEIRERLMEMGTTFPNAFAPFATCCPSRSTILRGQYPHNHGVVANYGAFGGVGRYREMGDDKDNVATRLDAAGYETGLFGKYLNGYRGGYVPPGWDSWHAAAGGYQNMTTYEEDGYKKHDFKSRHETDVYGDKAKQFVTANKGRPWFAYVAFHSPHSPTYFEDRYAKEYATAVAPKPSSFDERDVSDKPEWIRRLPRVSDADTKGYDLSHRHRLRAMRSVDDTVVDLLNTLTKTGQSENTYIVLWNDNGYHMGQHRIPKGKRTAYEEDVRYPLVIRGPGVKRGARDARLVSGADLLPTFLDMAGVATPDYADGRSLVPLLSGAGDVGWRDALLLEGYDDGFSKKEYVPPDFKAIRTSDGRVFVQYETGEEELYHLDADRNQTQSLHEKSAYSEEIEELSDRLATLKDCSAAGCRTAEATNP